MQVHLSSGNYNIIASGEAFLFGPYEDLTIQVEEGHEIHVSIVLKFVESASGEYDVKTDIINNSLIITCMNFSSIGTGLKRPAHIADINEKKVFFMFSSSYLGSNEDRARNVKYTVFCEK